MLSQAQLYVLHSISMRPLERLWQLPHDAPAGAYMVSLQRLRQRGLIEQIPDDPRYRITAAGTEALSGFVP